MSTLQEDKNELLLLLKQKAFCREKVTLSSGKESDFYIDARRVSLSAKGAYLCGKIIWELIKEDKPDAAGGPTLGADPIVGALAVISLQAGRPLDTFIIRKALKPYGKQRQIEGPLLSKGARVVLIDDVATTGKSIIQSLDVLEKMGIKAAKAVCLVDREEGARETLAQRNCQLVSIFNLSDFVK